MRVGQEQNWNLYFCSVKFWSRGGFSLLWRRARPLRLCVLLPWLWRDVAWVSSNTRTPPAPGLLQLRPTTARVTGHRQLLLRSQSGYAWRSDEGGDWDVAAPPDNGNINQTHANELTETEKAAAQSFGSTTSNFYDVKKKLWQNVWWTKASNDARHVNSLMVNLTCFEACNSRAQFHARQHHRDA